MCYFNAQKLKNQHPLKLAQFSIALDEMQQIDDAVQAGFSYPKSVVIKQISGNPEATFMEWGFTPSYIPNRESLQRFRFGGIHPVTKQFEPPIVTLNAISEELLHKPTYKQAALNHHCLIPSTGFFEWRHIYPISKKTGLPLKTAVKIPYYIHLRGQQVFYMAGIWTPWTDQLTGEYTESFSILTTRANSMMEQIHNQKKRMPVILTEAAACAWLLDPITPAGIEQNLLGIVSENSMEAWPVAKDFQKSTEPSLHCNWPDLPPLNLI